MRLHKEFFKQDTVKVAKALLGKIIQYKGTAGMIVETEAYKGSPDMASHAAKRTPRSAIMFDTFGKFYIYFVYGNYFCLNITTEEYKPGAVLIRALQPLEGIKIMKKRRGTKDVHNLTSGPGKLCQALGITKKLNGTEVNDKIKIYEPDNKLMKKLNDINKKNSLSLKPLSPSKLSPKFKIVAAERIGIKKAKHLKWRFYIKGNEFVSKK